MVLIRTEIRAILSSRPTPLEGLSSLAIGADQMFAELVLASGGSLTAVIPAKGVASSMDDVDRTRFEQLRACASHEVVLDFEVPSEEAYDAAGKWIAEQSDLLIAVWDSQPARGLGGTADAVAHAQAAGTEVAVVWPDGAERE